MTYLRRHVTSALAPLCQEQRFRPTATIAPFAGAPALPWAQASFPCRKYKTRRRSKDKAPRGFIDLLPSDALGLNQKCENIDGVDQTTDDKKSVPRAADNAHTSRTEERGCEEPDLLKKQTSSLWDSPVMHLRPQFVLPMGPAARELMRLCGPPADPEVGFDQGEPAPKLPWTQDTTVHSLEGYSSDAENIRIHFKLGRLSNPARGTMELSKLYLRDICQCSKCISPSSGRKTFATCDIPTVPRLRDPDTESIRLSADGGLEITWEDDFLTGDTHTSVYSQEFLNHLAEYDGKTYQYHHLPPLLWNRNEFQHGIESRVITYSDWMEGGSEFARAILDLHRRGLVFMREVPKSRYSVQRIAEKIGNLSSTIRGLTWDVISQPESEHAADNNQYLRLHQDLLYSNNMPQVKFLHCLENECQGGVSLFSDGLRAAAQLQREDRRSFKALSLHLATFSCDKAGHYLTRRRHVIEAGIGQPPRSVSWSPAFQTPFRVKEHREPSRVPKTRWQPNDGMLRVWRKAARVFRDSLESPENVIQHRLQPGDCVIFDNTRVLHGRTPVDASAGLRHLRGAYIDGEILKSATIHLNNKGLLKPDYREGPHELWRRSLEEDAFRDFDPPESAPGLHTHLK